MADGGLWPWVAFNAVVIALLALDLGVFHRKAHAVSVREAAIWSAICGALDVPLSRVLADAGEEMERAELASVAHVSAANIDATTKVVIPHVVSMAVA